jgi:cobalt-precorrin-7 (C5)-methyltransferase
MISVIGMGPGDARLRTQAAQALIAQADILVGWARLLADFPDFQGEKYVLNADIDGLIDWLQSKTEQNIVVLASGDPLLFGIGKRITERLPKQSCQIISGISSIQYLFARVQLDMNDLYITSSHGKQPDFDFIFQHDKVAMVTDKVVGPFQIAQEILQRGLSRTLIVGENLSYPDERLHFLQPEQVQPDYDMNVVVILNERQ